LNSANNGSSKKKLNNNGQTPVSKSTKIIIIYPCHLSTSSTEKVPQSQTYMPSSADRLFSYVKASWEAIMTSRAHIKTRHRYKTGFARTATLLYPNSIASLMTIKAE
jgi:hypothetical protein